jgi:NIPSNAP
MKRREFLAASGAVAVGLASTDFISSSQADDAKSEPIRDRLIIEIRKYHFAGPTKQDAYEKFLQAAAIPAYNRAGSTPVGVFRLLAKDNPQLKLDADSTDIWLVLPHKSLEAVLTFETRLAADKVFQDAGQEILAAPKSEPAFTRYESTLLYAFEGFQKVAPPEKSDSRLLEMRTYENPNQERALNKMKMFNSGEIPIFQRVGMPGVFFGEAVAGPNLPQLTYMVPHRDLESVAADWKVFGSDPDWQKMKADPEYKDNVSTVSRYFLRPTAGSQI